MIHVNDLTISFGSRPLFEDVQVKFTPGNCYGIIGANGAGKSTFLKILSGELEADRGEVILGPRCRLAVLKQDHFAHEDEIVRDVVMMGHSRLWKVSSERDALYAKADFSDEDGVRAGELEIEFMELGGYEAEQELLTLLTGLGIEEELHGMHMRELEEGKKVRVLLSQALFGEPDILLLDEPTNGLDWRSIEWLEDYLINYQHTVLVVSHDRQFLNNVCTHIADIDYRKLRVYVGNYSFWQQASELVEQQRRDQSKKNADKAKDLKAFIERFSSNASKARQATSRKKMLEELKLGDLPVSTRKYPHIDFKPERACGKSVLEVKNLTASVDGRTVIKNLSFMINQDDKVAIVGYDDVARTTLMRILAGEHEPDSGEITWGTTITKSYFPKNHEEFFDSDLKLTDWLRQWASHNATEDVMRGMLGRMLFSGEEATKAARVLSGGEKVRCMLSRMMLQDANVLLLDEPTNHLDLESITALNNALIKYSDVVLFTSPDREFVNTIATRIFEITALGDIQRYMPFDEYLQDENVRVERGVLYADRDDVRV